VTEFAPQLGGLPRYDYDQFLSILSDVANFSCARITSVAQNHSDRLLQPWNRDQFVLEQKFLQSGFYFKLHIVVRPSARGGNESLCNCRWRWAVRLTRVDPSLLCEHGDRWFSSCSILCVFEASVVRISWELSLTSWADLLCYFRWRERDMKPA
jgi:hypothetical protein